jgi:hypothetical protein
MRPRREPEPGGKVTSRPEPVRIWNQRFDGRRRDRADTRDRAQTTHVFVALCLGDDLALKSFDLLGERVDLVDKACKGEARCRRQASIRRVVSRTIAANAATFAGPAAAMMPNSDK